MDQSYESNRDFGVKGMAFLIDPFDPHEGDHALSLSASTIALRFVPFSPWPVRFGPTQSPKRTLQETKSVQPIAASALCHRQSTPPNSSQFSISAAQTRVNTPLGIQR